MKQIVVIILLMVVSFCSKAQVDSAQAIVSGDAEQAPAAAPILPDTSLIINPLFIPRDSVEALKNLPSLAYLKNLETVLKAAKAEKMAAVKDDPPQDHSWLSSFFASSATKYFFWIVGAGFVLFIIYKLFFTQGIFQRQTASAKVKEESLTDDIAHSVLEYNKLIERAVATNNLRLAVRYLYLQALQQLSDDKLIQLAPDKTNHQYLFELKDRRLKDLFSLLTLHYEYVWYGGFNINETIFTAVRQSFKEFKDQL
jgi:uncharacterized protein DUF4129